MHGYSNNNHTQVFIPKYKTLDRNKTVRVEREKKPSETTVADDNVIPHVTKKWAGIRWGDRLNPRLFYSVTYLLAIGLFLIFVNLETLPNLYYPTLENLLPVRLFNQKIQRTLMVELLWGVHFVRRFGEVLFVYEYSSGVTWLEVVTFTLFHVFFSVWIGWSCNSNIFYRTPPDALFIPGILICFVGGTGNFISHKYLQRMSLSRYRYEPPPYRVIPEGCCFYVVDCPHYVFEIITWIGFSLTAFTLASWTFTLAVTIILTVRAYNKHTAYQQQFKGDYPTRRKALIPLVF